jgi:hypothetical protein
VTHHWDEHGGIPLTLDNGESVRADKGMLARFVPVAGDYWVIQSDGYIYLNPAAVFERKYSRCADVSLTSPYADFSRITFKKATCRGSLMMGSACGHCERCDWERQNFGFIARGNETQKAE